MHQKIEICTALCGWHIPFPLFIFPSPIRSLASKRLWLSKLMLYSLIGCAVALSVHWLVLLNSHANIYAVVMPIAETSPERSGSIEELSTKALVSDTHTGELRLEPLPR